MRLLSLHLFEYFIHEPFFLFAHSGSLHFLVKFSKGLRRTLNLHCLIQFLKLPPGPAVFNPDLQNMRIDLIQLLSWLVQFFFISQCDTDKIIPFIRRNLCQKF